MYQTDGDQMVISKLKTNVRKLMIQNTTLKREVENES